MVELFLTMTNDSLFDGGVDVKKMNRKLTRRLAFILVLAMMLALIGCTPESPPADPPSVTPTEVVVGVSSDTPTPVPSVSATPTVDPTVTNTPTPTEGVLSVTPTEEVTPTSTPTDEPEVTDTPTPDPTATDTPVPTNTPTKVPDTPTPVVTNTPKPTVTPTKAPTKAPTATPTQPPATNTPTPKPTATNTPTPEPTQVVGYVVPPLLDAPVTMWVKENNTGLIIADTYYESRANGSFVTTFSGSFLQKGDEVSVIRAKDDCGYVSIRSGNTTGLVSINALSETLIEGKWAEPRERKDLEEILMAKVNAYRESMGVPKFESPFVYFDEFEPNAGANMTAEGLAVAKEQCLKQDARHNTRQIGTGWYGSAIRQKQGGLTNEQLCEKLFQQWKNSPGHNANMLDNNTQDGYRIVVAVMTVVEYYDGYSYGYCAILTYNWPIVSK